jgi:hypothetical protein
MASPAWWGFQAGTSMVALGQWQRWRGERRFIGNRGGARSGRGGGDLGAAAGGGSLEWFFSHITDADTHTYMTTHPYEYTYDLLL